MNEDRAASESQAQFRRIVVRTMLLMAFAALLLGVGRVLGDWQPEHRAIRLATGDILYFRGATFGTEHEAPNPPRLMQWLPSFLRDPLVRYLRLSNESGRLTTVEPRLVLWLDDTHPFVGNREKPVTIHWMLGDQTGEPSGARQLSRLPAREPGLIAVEFEVYPRRSRILQLQAFTPDMTGVLRPAGHLIVSNRHFTAATEWEPQAMPLVQVNGSVECTLLALPTGVKAQAEWTTEEDASITLTGEPAEPGNEVRTTAVLAFRGPGVETADWTVEKIVLSDAPGNVLQPSNTSTTRGPGIMLFSFGPGLWPEDTWRIELLARPVGHELSPANEENVRSFTFQVRPERSAANVWSIRIPSAVVEAATAAQGQD
jgi:hypothetical protein